MIITSIVISIVAFVYSTILTDEGMILSKFKGYLYMKIGKYPNLFKPLIDCAYCVSGQIALWYNLYLVFIAKTLTFDLVYLVSVISLSIFNIAIIKKLKVYE